MPAVADDHATLATRRPASALPGPDFHRLDRTSLAWRTHIYALLRMSEGHANAARGLRVWLNDLAYRSVSIAGRVWNGAPAFVDRCDHNIKVLRPSHAHAPRCYG